MTPDTITYLESEVAASREHLQRATANLEAARRSLGSSKSTALVTVPDRVAVRCGRCGTTVEHEEFTAHVRRCNAERRALRDAVMEETSMDRLAGRQLES